MYKCRPAQPSLLILFLPSQKVATYYVLYIVISFYPAGELGLLATRLPMDGPSAQKYVWLESSLFKKRSRGPNIFTTPLRQWGFRQCLPFSWTTLKGKHCWHLITIIGVVDTFGRGLFVGADIL